MILTSIHTQPQKCCQVYYLLESFIYSAVSKWSSYFKVFTLAENIRP